MPRTEEADVGQGWRRPGTWGGLGRCVEVFFFFFVALVRSEDEGEGAGIREVGGGRGRGGGGEGRGGEGAGRMRIGVVGNVKGGGGVGNLCHYLIRCSRSEFEEDSLLLYIVIASRIVSLSVGASTLAPS